MRKVERRSLLGISFLSAILAVILILLTWMDSRQKPVDPSKAILTTQPVEE